MNAMFSDNLAIVGVFAIAALMLRAWLTHREKMKGLSMTKQGVAPSDQRLARVEQAVEAIAIEVERISEGQRYVTKLMSDRAQQPRVEGVAIPMQPRRMDTPY
jgi:FtsZ-interacting cell division protein ZipA